MSWVKSIRRELTRQGMNKHDQRQQWKWTWFAPPNQKGQVGVQVKIRQNKEDIQERRMSFKCSGL